MIQKMSDVQAYLATLAAHLENLGDLDVLQRSQVLSAYNRLSDADAAEVERARRRIQQERPTLDLTKEAAEVVRRVYSAPNRRHGGSR